MIPYWSLGFQLCRWGYENIDHMKDAVGRLRQYDIPHVSPLEVFGDFIIPPFHYSIIFIPLFRYVFSGYPVFFFQDVQYGDIDYMRDYLDFTIDEVNFAGLREYVDLLKQEGTRYVIILVSCQINIKSSINNK